MPSVIQISIPALLVCGLTLATAPATWAQSTPQPTASPLATSASPAVSMREGRIQPWSHNLRYWEYQGRPLLLVGGSQTDHLFLFEDLKLHLDEIQSVGANYVRNTMSQREGPELKPHKLLPDGKFDLDEWNSIYWQRFQDMLQWTAEREIIVQIEIWDRFDYAGKHWDTSPWNPANNVNYDQSQSGLVERYSNEQLYNDTHPFFNTIQGTDNYQKPYDLIRKYQVAFVDKMLSSSLPYGHVLYCMNNETSSDPAWGKFWIEHVQDQAAVQGLTVCTTDMFDDAYQGASSKRTPLIFADPKHYQFADISQVNSRNYDDRHWERLLWLLKQMEQHPRPSNHTKIYGSGFLAFGTGSPEDGVQRFWRDLLAGSAAARFHRPDAGNGLNDFAKGSIKAVRLLEKHIKLWDTAPHQELLSDRKPNEAYLAARPGKSYALYFTDSGSVGLDLTAAPGTFDITWISLSMGTEVQTSAAGGYQLMDKTVSGGSVIKLTAPYKGGWVAAIVKR